MLDALKAKLAEKAKKTAQITSNYLEEANFKVTELIREERLDICKSCNELHKTTEFCKVCGCFMPAKTWLANTSCPLKKWVKIEKQA